MGRGRRRSMLEDSFEMLLELLKVVPIWVGPILAVVAFVLFRFVFPELLPANPGGTGIGEVWRSLYAMFSWVSAGAVLLAWVVAEVWKFGNRRLLDRQTDLASIKKISWREFERLVGEAYRRKGYLAEIVGTDSGDGGVDVRLNGHGETVLVQCKQWKAYKVGVTTVRELLGVVVSERADKGVVVTSGRFTQEAATFARRNPQIELLDGPGLAELIRGVRVGSSETSLASPTPANGADGCPVCGAQMILRTARKG
jgi:restriction system protein